MVLEKWIFSNNILQLKMVFVFLGVVLFYAFDMNWKFSQGEDWLFFFEKKKQWSYLDISKWSKTRKLKTRNR